MKKQIIISFLGLTLLINAGEFYYSNGNKVELSKVEVSQTIGSRMLNSRTKYYKTATGKSIGVRDDILIECVANKDCKEVLSKYEITEISQLTDSIYIIKISSDKNVFEFAQKLYGDNNIKIAHPNLRKIRNRR
jgi:hypothetical protein